MAIGWIILNEWGENPVIPDFSWPLSQLCIHISNIVYSFYINPKQSSRVAMDHSLTFVTQEAGIPGFGVI